MLGLLHTFLFNFTHLTNKTRKKVFSFFFWFFSFFLFWGFVIFSFFFGFYLHAGRTIKQNIQTYHGGWGRSYSKRLSRLSLSESV